MKRGAKKTPKKAVKKKRVKRVSAKKAVSSPKKRKPVATSRKAKKISSKKSVKRVSKKPVKTAKKSTKPAPSKVKTKGKAVVTRKTSKSAVKKRSKKTVTTSKKKGVLASDSSVRAAKSSKKTRKSSSKKAALLSDLAVPMSVASLELVDVFSSQKLSYGGKVLNAFLPERVLKEKRLVTPEACMGEEESPEVVSDLSKAVKLSLFQPGIYDRIPSLPIILRDYYKGGTVSVVIPHLFYKTTHISRVLEPLLKALSSYHIDKDHVRLVIATGDEKPLEHEAEFKALLGETLWDDYRLNVEVHDPKVGLSSIGDYVLEDEVHPIKMNKTVAKSDVVLVLSEIHRDLDYGLVDAEFLLSPSLLDQKSIQLIRSQMINAKGMLDYGDGTVSRESASVKLQRGIAGFIQRELRKKRQYIYGVSYITNDKQEVVEVSGGQIDLLRDRLLPTLTQVSDFKASKKVDVLVQASNSLGSSFCHAIASAYAGIDTLKEDGHFVLLAPCDLGIGNKYQEKAFQILSDLSSSLASLEVKSKKERKAKEVTLVKKARKVLKDYLQENRVQGEHRLLTVLDVMERVGCSRFYLISDGLSEDQKACLPVVYPGRKSEIALKRLRELLEEIDASKKGVKFCILGSPYVRVEA